MIATSPLPLPPEAEAAGTEERCPLKPLAAAQALSAELAAAAQAVYDEWDEEDVDTYAGGGICHLIADALCEVFEGHGINAASAASNFEQHVFTMIQTAEGVYCVDIPCESYERGGGYSWTKLPWVRFTRDHLVFTLINRDPSRFDREWRD